MQIDINILSQRDYEKLCRSPEEVCKLVEADLKAKGITQSAAAERMGVSRQLVYGQLLGKNYFSKKASQRYAETFGYNVRFLQSGIGYLNIDPALDARLYPSKTIMARAKSISNSYIRYKELHEQVKELTDKLEQITKENNKLKRSLIAEKDRNIKLLHRIEKLTDMLEDQHNEQLKQSLVSR